MWLMLQQKQPSDYVVATGATHSIRELVELAFQQIGKKIVYVETSFYLMYNAGHLFCVQIRFNSSSATGDFSRQKFFTTERHRRL